MLGLLCSHGDQRRRLSLGFETVQSGHLGSEAADGRSFFFSLCNSTFQINNLKKCASTLEWFSRLWTRLLILNGAFFQVLGTCSGKLDEDGEMSRD